MCAFPKAFGWLDEVEWMPQRQGKRLSDHEVRRVKSLLANSDLSIDEIAKRIGRSKSAIFVINKKFKIRQYRGGRSSWVVKTKSQQD
jgi:transposase